MMRPDAKVKKVYLYPKPVDFRKSIDGLAALVEIVPMQIRVIKHVRKVYGCRDCESAPVTADKPA